MQTVEADQQHMLDRRMFMFVFMVTFVIIARHCAHCVQTGKQGNANANGALCTLPCPDRLHVPSFLVAKKYSVRRAEFAVDLSQPDESTLSIA
jgi:hypothetical protein